MSSDLARRRYTGAMIRYGAICVLLVALAGCHRAPQEKYAAIPAATRFLTCDNFYLGDALTQRLHGFARSAHLDYTESRANDAGTRAYVQMAAPDEQVTMAFGIGDFGAVTVQDYPAATSAATEAGPIYTRVLPLFAGCRPRTPAA